MDAAVLAFVIILCRVMNFDSVFFNVKVFKNEPRADKSINVSVRIENYSRSSEIATQLFNIVCFQRARLLESRFQFLWILFTALDRLRARQASGYDRFLQNV